MDIGESIIPAGYEPGTVERTEHGGAEHLGPDVVLHELGNERAAGE